MAKFLLILVLACVVWRHFTGRWPWQPKPKSKSQGDCVPSVETVKARALLGVDVQASRKDVLEAHRRRLAQVHPDRGGSNELVFEANAARDVLLADLPAE